MSLQDSDLTKLAQLAQLELSPEERGKILTQLQSFFDLVEQMQNAPTQGVEPLSHPLSAIMPITARLRDDVVTQGDQRQASQLSAPSVQDGLYLVPKVVE